MRLRKAIEQLPPYPSLVLLGIAWLIVESTKLAALALAGEGHWLGGASFLVCAYGAGALGTERLFVIVKPKLLKLVWFASIWRYASRIYSRLRRRKFTFSSGRRWNTAAAIEANGPRRPSQVKSMELDPSTTDRPCPLDLKFRPSLGRHPRHQAQDPPGSQTHRLVL
jgi:hypothetical protein